MTCGFFFQRPSSLSTLQRTLLMDPLLDANIASTITLWLLVILLCSKEFFIHAANGTLPYDDDKILQALQELDKAPLRDTLIVMRTSVQNFRLYAALNIYHDEMLYWVKPHSTIWFSKFLIEQYDKSRWVSMFRMTKPTIFSFVEVIKPHVEKKNTRYRLAIPVFVKVACTLFKLAHGANFTIYSEFFAIGKSTVSRVLREVVYSINECLKAEIAWPWGAGLQTCQQKFATLCSLPAVVGAIDGVHISIAKPQYYPSDYYYFKSGGYSINCQVVVDSNKRFLDLCVGMPGSTNDSRVLRRSTLFHLASHGNLFDPAIPVEGFTPYLIGDSRYSLLPWLMTPHREVSQLAVHELSFNLKLKRGRAVVENAFDILKQIFRELLTKSDLHLTFLPDVVVCYAILYNILLRQSHDDVEQLLEILSAESHVPEETDHATTPELGPSRCTPAMATGVATMKWHELGVFVERRRSQCHLI